MTTATTISTKYSWEQLFTYQCFPPEGKWGGGVEKGRVGSGGGRITLAAVLYLPFDLCESIWLTAVENSESKSNSVSHHLENVLFGIKLRLAHLSCFEKTNFHIKIYGSDIQQI